MQSLTMHCYDTAWPIAARSTQRKVGRRTIARFVREIAGAQVISWDRKPYTKRSPYYTIGPF